ncbi:MAG: hypothetical protein LBV04_03570, partial [Deferribacteraceae bacterium]|nr:hypothetical protein [Deferribacteraceae bacterium]
GEKEDELLDEARAEKPRIKVKGAVYEGITVSFFNSSSTIRERAENIVFYLDVKYKEVAWVSLKDANTIDDL